MDAAAEIWRNSRSKHQICSAEYGNEQAGAGRDCRTSRETKFSGANGDREIFIFPVQLTTSRIVNFIYAVDLYLATGICGDNTYINTYIHTYASGIE